MKRLVIIVMIAILCLSICGCKDEKAATKQAPAAATPTTVLENSTCTQQAILMLMESNLDCHNIFYMKPLDTTTQKNSDGYLGVDPNGIITDYKTLEELVRNTYSKECADKMLSYPSKETPLYKEVQGQLFVNPDVAQFDPDYSIYWDNCTVEIITNTDTKCEFKLTTNADSKPYYVTGTAVYENGRWLLTKVLS